MAVYPAQLPSPDVAGYEYTGDDPLVRTDMESGAPRVRRRYTAVANNVIFTWSFSQAELALFEGWHRHVLMDGAIWFDVQLASGAGINAVQALFKKRYRVRMVSQLRWQVSAEVTVRQPPVMSRAETLARLGL